MDSVLFVGYLLVFMILLHFAKKLCMVLAWRFFGWRPSILDKDLMEATTEKCCKMMEENWTENPESGWQDYSDAQKQKMREDWEEYTRFVVQQYVLKYSLAK